MVDGRKDKGHCLNLTTYFATVARPRSGSCGLRTVASGCMWVSCRAFPPGTGASGSRPDIAPLIYRKVGIGTPAAIES